MFGIFFLGRTENKSFTAVDVVGGDCGFFAVETQSVVDRVDIGRRGCNICVGGRGAGGAVMFRGGF